MASSDIFNRSNVSASFMKRFSKFQTKNADSSSKNNNVTEKTEKSIENKSVSNQATSPTGKKAALEKLLLSIPLDADVATFSENKSSNPFIPLYSDSYEPSFCLPSSGYKSDSEHGSRKIRTSISASTSPQGSPTSLRRSRSLNTVTATDRIFEIRERLLKSKREKEEKEAKSRVNATNSLLKEKKSTSIGRSRSFNTHRTLKTTRQRQEEETNELQQVRNNLHSTKNDNKKHTVDDNNNTRKSFGNNTTLRSNSFTTLQDAWEYRRNKKTPPFTPQEQQESKEKLTENKKDYIPVNINGEKVHRRHTRKSLRQRELSRKSDRSDSETESEDGRLTEAALKRLEGRSLLRLNQSNIHRRRSNRFVNDVITDDNNNEFLSRFETSSDKTLDSGIFDIAISNLSEDITKLSKRYDSNEFLLDDCLSPKSGYSSATESLTSLAESTTTFYDSENDILDMESRKKRITKSQSLQNKPTVKSAVMNSLSRSLHETPGTPKTSKNIGHEHCCKPYSNNKTLATTKAHVTRSGNDQIRKSDNIDRKTSTRKSLSTELNNNNRTSNSRESSSSKNSLSSNHSNGHEKHGVSSNLKERSQSSTSLQATKNNKLYSNNKLNISTPQLKKTSPNPNHQKELTKTKDSPSEADIMAERNQSKNFIKNQSFDKQNIRFAKKCTSKSLRSEPINEQPNDNKSLSHGNETKTKQLERETKDKSNNIIINDGKKDKLNINSKINHEIQNESLHTDDNTDHSDMEFPAKTKFLVERRGSLVDQSQNTRKLLTRGESIEVQITLDPTTKLNKDTPINTTPLTLKPASKDTNNTSKQPISPQSNTLKSVSQQTKTTQQDTKVKEDTSVRKNTPPKVSKKPDYKSTLKSTVEINHNSKGIQCQLLTDHIKAITSKGTLVDISDTTKHVIISENVSNELGKDILENIEYKLPEYLNMSNENLDEVDSAALVKDTIMQNEDPEKLKVANVRLQNLLFEVEKARVGSVKALLHVNNLLNKVQSKNIQLEGEIKVCLLEKEKLLENVKNIEENSSENDNSKGTEKERGRSDTVDRSLSIIVNNWKIEKKNLMDQLNKSKTKQAESERDAGKLRIQYKKIKEQLEHSNNAFATTLQNNLQATKKLEEELQNSLSEKQELIKKLNDGKKVERELETLKQEFEELEASHIELQDENDHLEEKCAHLEKQKKCLLLEQEELHEQIGHSQEIIDNLTDAEDVLREKLSREVKDKEYLQECLEETGQILYQLQNNEKKLLEDKDTLLGDLEAELEEKKTLQTELTETMSEHKEIVDRLQQMNNIHITVKESLQQANKKEKNYQEEIEVLTKTNHILHYTLELEKEEKADLKEMFEVIDLDHKKFKSEMVGKMRDMEKKQEQLTEENLSLKESKDELEENNARLQEENKSKTEENANLKEELINVKTIRESIEKELENLRNSGDSLERNISELRRQCHDLEVELKREQKKVEVLTTNIEETEESLEIVTKELTETKSKLEEHRNDNADLREKFREKQKRLRDIESTLSDTSEQRDKYQNRMQFFEKETKELRKQVNEQTEEIGTLQLENQRFGRERDNYKRNCDMVQRDFDTHKLKCTETLKKLKEEIIDLSNKIVEKDRIHMKQKEQFQDQIDNTQSDLQLFRSMLDSDLKKRVRRSSTISETSFEAEKIDIDVLKNSHGKSRDEFKNQMSKLEGMLKNTNDHSDTVTVVQSPMSKIKLDELKQIRNEIFEVNTELANLRHKFGIAATDIKKLQSKYRTFPDEKPDNITITRTTDLESELSRLNNLMVKIERRHQAVMSQNAMLLQRTLTEDDRTAKDLVKKFQVVSLEGENKQLKTLLGILKKKYDFDETEIAEELKRVTESTNGLTIPSDNSILSEDDQTSRKNVPVQPSTTTDSNLRYKVGRSNSRRSKNYSFFNEAMNTNSDFSSTPTRKYNRELHTRSSGVSSYSSDEDDFTPPTRFPKRNRRPRT